jgi:hypothetical protein
MKLPNAVTSKFARQILVAEKHSPRILFVAGIGLMGATVVSACRGTLKLEDTLRQAQLENAVLNETLEANPDKYSTRDAKKLHTLYYFRNVGRVAKLYAPAFIFGSLSVAALTSSHNIMTKRNAGLSAALAATQKAMHDYRQRVRDEYGDEKELKLYRDNHVEAHAVLDDQGRETASTVKKKVGGGKSPYARWFGKDSTLNWNDQAEYNLAFLCAQQEYANDRLRAKGHLFLNDIYDSLGLPRTPAGSQVGWLWNKGDGDQYVDFGVMNGDMSEFLEFVTGHEDGIWLDFNVDGEIWRNI